MHDHAVYELEDFVKYLHYSVLYELIITGPIRPETISPLYMVGTEV